MIALSSLILLPVVLAVQVPQFVPPSEGPLVASSDYVGSSNSSLPKTQVVSGKAFNRIINIWLENTDFSSANSTPIFNTLATQGIRLDQYCALTHPSEPNYVASVGGDFWGMGDDNLYNIPPNISTVVDLLEAKNISWASYQENIPFDGYEGYNYTSKNYVNTSAPGYVYYVRKHNPTMIYDSVASVPSRLAKHRNFNDFAVDVNASALPQWMFVTPNMVDDGHDTSVDYAASWLQYWLVPLLSNPNFNDNGTLVVLTFDENESYTENNCVLTLLLGGAVPESARGTTDSTYYTHYSLLSTVEANWGLGSLGRGDTNKTLSNVFSFVAATTGYTNVNVSSSDVLTNLTGVIPGPLNPGLYVPFAAPNTSAVGAGGGSVFVEPSLNTSFTAAVAPPPVNLTQQNKTLPWSGPRNGSNAGTNSSSGNSGKSSAVDEREGVIGAAIFGTILAGVATLLV
ncbi:phosphoesterase family-domain-containing protein [Russula emetica]|nr:phosphoesterase family-domain-containing protein [Russula emetica]KAF8492154.1 phosphoesterase family-domain-containing protein [Russula emetica]